jgi:uncharacterized membrane protein YdjX (TVP38/TMEM64 family)
MTRESASKPRLDWGSILPAAAAFLFVTGGTLYLMNTLGPDRLRQSIIDAGPLAPLVYIGLRALTYVFAPLTTGPIQVASGALFGVWEGILYSLLGEVLGGSINFWIGRKLGRPVVLRIAGESGLAKAEEYYHLVEDWRGLAVARLVLFAMWDFLSYVIGFTSARFVHYVLVSFFVGAIPTAAAVFLGAQLSGDNLTLLTIAMIAVCIIVSLPLVFGGRIRKWLKGRSASAGIVSPTAHSVPAQTSDNLSTDHNPEMPDLP